MQPFLASRLAAQREEDLRRRAEVFRLLAEAHAAGPRRHARWSARLRASAGRVASVAARGRSVVRLGGLPAAGLPLRGDHSG